jgi:IS30 family transposase
VYQRIAANRRVGGTLYLHRRCQKCQRKHYGSTQQQRGVLKNRVSIDERPDIVNYKSQAGHWKGDTVVGAHQQGGIITLTERCSNFLLVAGIQSKHAA